MPFAGEYPSIDRGGTVKDRIYATERDQKTGDPMLNDKQFKAYTEHEINKHWLKTLRQDRDELMDKINQLDRLEVSIIEVMGKEGEG